MLKAIVEHYLSLIIVYLQSVNWYLGAPSWNIGSGHHSCVFSPCSLMVACIYDTDSSENMLCWLTASLLTCRASALKKEHRWSFLWHQCRRLDKTLIKTSRSHPRLLSASLPQICWCQILWQLKGAAIDVIHKLQQSSVCLPRPNGVRHQNKLLFPARTCSLPLLPPHRGSRINIFVCQEASPAYLFHLFIYIFPTKNLVLFLWPQPGSLTYVLATHSSTPHW